MIEMNKPRGLCINCENNSTCVFSIRNQESVFECEEYAVTDAIHVDSPLDGENTGKSMARISEKDARMGLCCNCDARQSCRKSENEGGVWHCEEYQ